MGITTLRDTLDEARRFLSLPQTDRHRAANPPASRGSPEAARRLWAMGQPMSGTLAERYLAGRGLTGLGHLDSLRFHPNCFYWREDHALTDPPETWPALLAKVTDLDGRLTGLHRTWLDPATADKAPVIPPRKAMGNLLGHGVRIGKPVSVLAAGEGLETMLSLHLALPKLACGGGSVRQSSRSPAAARRSSPPLHRRRCRSGRPVRRRPTGASGHWGRDRRDPPLPLSRRFQ